jgi:uncharacterized membrane protein
MKPSYTPGLALGIGIVAGLRAFTAPAALSWAAKRRWIRLGNSPFATIISGQASKRIIHLAVTELIADKLPFTPSRLKAGPLASRVVSGAVCGATIYGAVEQPLIEGAILGGVGAIAGAFAGHYGRRKFSRGVPDLGVAVLEDILAIGGAAMLTALTIPAKTARAKHTFV